MHKDLKNRVFDSVWAVLWVSRMFRFIPTQHLLVHFQNEFIQTLQLPSISDVAFQLLSSADSDAVRSQANRQGCFDLFNQQFQAGTLYVLLRLDHFRENRSFYET